MHDSSEGAGAAQVEMPQYVSHKKVWALEIDYFGADLTLHFKDIGYTPIQTHKEMWSRYVPVPGDFYVVYADGYKSFSPRKAFLEGYTKVAAAVDPSVRRRHSLMDGR